MGSVRNGKIKGAGDLQEPLTMAMEAKTERVILRVISPNLSGLICIRNGQHVVGAQILGSNVGGTEAIRSLLMVTQGVFSLFEPDPDSDFSALEQNLQLGIGSLIGQLREIALDCGVPVENSRLDDTRQMGAPSVQRQAAPESGTQSIWSIELPRRSKAKTKEHRALAANAAPTPSAVPVWTPPADATPTPSAVPAWTPPADPTPTPSAVPVWTPPASQTPAVVLAWTPPPRTSPSGHSATLPSERPSVELSVACRALVVIGIVIVSAFAAMLWTGLNGRQRISQSSTHLPVAVAQADSGQDPAALYSAGHYADAAKMAQELCLARPNDTRAKMLGGMALARLGNYADGLKVLAAVPDQNKTAAARVDEGFALAGLNRLQDALAVLQSVAEQDPKLAQARRERAAVEAKLGMDDAAIADLKLACALDGKTSADFSRLGVLYENAGKFPEAVVQFRTARSLGAGTEYELDIARCLNKQRKFEEAAEACKKLLAANPDDSDAQALLNEIKSGH